MSLKHTKRKGKRFEDFIADSIQSVFDLSNLEVHRAQSSGTFQTDFGDIRFNIPLNKLNYIPVIEAKFQKSFDLDQLIHYFVKYQKFPKWFVNWWTQTEIDAKKAQQKTDNQLPVLPMLIVKRNYTEPMVIIRKTDYHNPDFFDLTKLVKIKLYIQLDNFVIIPFKCLLPAMKFLKQI